MLKRKLRFIQHSPLATLEQYGDLVDLQFTSIDKVFYGKVVVNGDLITYSKGSSIRFSLGVSIELPKNHKANVYPRSGTFKNSNLILTNSVGQIDESYKGDNDIWMAHVYALEDGQIKLGERMLQFEMVRKQPKLKFERVLSLGNKNRGGFGSSGK